MEQQINIYSSLGMITGASIVIGVWVCANSTHLNDAGSTVQEVYVVNQ